MKEDAFADLYKDYVDRRVEEGRAEGEIKGREEGERKGRAEGRAEGREEGERKARAQIIAKLRSLGISEDVIERAASTG